MKKGMILFAVAALLSGAACSTYTSSTDPDDLGTGYAISGSKVGTGHNSSRGLAEVNNNATLDNPATGANTDSAATTSQADSTDKQKPSMSAPVRVQTDQHR